MVDISAKYTHYRKRFVAALKARSLTNEGFGERIEAHPVTVSKLRNGKLALDDEWRARVAAGLAIPEALLFGEDPLPAPRPAEIYVSPRKAEKRRRTADGHPFIPHYGLAAGSLIGAHTMANELPSEVPCPPGLRDVLGAYALTTRGESMVPRYNPGEILYVNPNQHVRAGDHVIIQVATHDSSETETFIKRYDGEKNGDVLCWQYNPAAQIAFKRLYVRHIHRVLVSNELFGTIA